MRSVGCSSKQGPQMAHQPAHKSGGRQRGGGVGFVVRYLKVAVFQLLKGQPVKVDSLVHGLYFYSASQV